MKKYQRLLLILISIISLSLFLIYRHHYNRLHHVLEVFNFFGTPCNISELQRSNGVLLEHDWGPQPIWQELDSKAYIYSAFLVEKNKIVGLGVRHKSVSLPKACFLLYEDHVKFVKAKLEAIKLLEDNTSGFIAYKYNCMFQTAEKSPFSIAFKSAGEQKYVSTLITNTLNVKVTLNSTVCITPSHLTKKMLLESLSFQNMLGVDSFIVYFTQNVPYKMIKVLKNMSNNLDMWVTFLPYNMPLSLPESFKNALIEYDCFYRTKSHTKYSIVLGVNEYIVPSLDGSMPTSMRLPVKRFCMNHISQNRPIILQNFESVDDHSFNDVKKVNRNYFKLDTDTKQVPNIFENYCVIFRYGKCTKGIKTKSDISMKAFSTDFTRSTLIQLLIREEI